MYFLILAPDFWGHEVSPIYQPKATPSNIWHETDRNTDNAENVNKNVFKCQNHSKMKNDHLPVIQWWNHLCCSEGHSCCWPGWTSEQTLTVKYLNSCMQPHRTQDTRKYKYLCSLYFIQLISLSGSCRCRAFAVWVLHLWPDCATEKSTCSYYVSVLFVVGVFCCCFWGFFN